MTGLIETEAGRKRLQQALADYLDPSGTPYYGGKIDGVLGDKSVDSIIRFRADHNIIYPPHPAAVDTDLERELGLLAIQSPIPVAVAKAHGIDLLTLIGLIGPIENLLKGKTMTADQITGILRAILTAIGGYLVGKGIVDQTTATSLIGAAVTIGGALWSLWSNRPKTIVPISAK